MNPCRFLRNAKKYFNFFVRMRTQANFPNFYAQYFITHVNPSSFASRLSPKMPSHAKKNKTLPIPLFILEGLRAIATCLCCHSEEERYGPPLLGFAVLGSERIKEKFRNLASNLDAFVC